MKQQTGASDERTLRELGARLSRHRLNRDWTQGRLAEEAGVSLPTISRLERGEPTSLVNFVRVLRALDLLGNLPSLVPEVPPSPVRQLRTRRPVPQRASGRGSRSAEDSTWTWDEPS